MRGARRYSLMWSRFQAFAGRASFAFIMLWGVLEPILALFRPLAEGLAAYGAHVLGAQAALAVAVGMPAILQRNKTSFLVHGNGPLVSVTFGDLLDRPGHLAIPVNEFFDDRLHTHVAPESLHGQLVTRLFTGDQTRLRTAFDAALEGAKSWPKNRQLDAPERRYEVGETAVLEHGSRRVYCFALSRTDAKTNRASADISLMMRALAGLWRSVDLRSNGEPVSVPLVGGGQSNVNHKPAQLLRLLFLSIVDASRECGRLPAIEVVLRPELKSEIDLVALAKEFG